MPWSCRLKLIHVAVGIVYNANSEILIAKRPLGKHLGGLWEFPGGKLEANESTLDALRRELHEEINIQLVVANPLTKIHFTYPEKQVLLDVWQISSFIGEAQGNEGQEIRWVSKEQLGHYPFPEANQAIFELL